jgi:hypothetical protein
MPIIEFINVVKSSSTRHKFQTETISLATILKDSLHMSTILLLGAVAQSLLCAFLPIRLAIAPAFLILLYRIVKVHLQAYHILPDHSLDNIVRGKVSAQLPDSQTGRFGSTPAQQPVVIFLLGVRFNHPLGTYSPGAKEIIDWNEKLNKDIRARADEFGLLGSSLWLGAKEGANNEILTISYFKDIEGLNKFAHDKLHRGAWDWYNKTKHQHIGKETNR